MVILVDTNIIIDALANREPYADDAKRIMEKFSTAGLAGPSGVWNNGHISTSKPLSA